MATARNLFSDHEDIQLVKFLAKYKPEPRGRLGQAIWQQLVENAEGKWPWAKSHSWQSWRERYKKNQELFDRKIRRYQKRQEQPEEEDDDVQEGPSTRTQKPEQAQTPRTKTRFTDSDDEHLAEFMATRGSNMGRLGNSLYIGLQAEATSLPWAKRHPWQSWRERYKKNQEKIEDLISGYESKKRVKKERIAKMPTEGTSRAESSAQVTQVSTSDSAPKEKEKDVPQKVPQPPSSHTKGKEGEAPASASSQPKAPEPSVSHSKGKERQKNDEVQPDRSTHVEMPQERMTGPGKNQRVKSETPAPARIAPPYPSINGKGKQKEAAPAAHEVGPAPQREISVPPIAVKSQPESDRDVDMHSLFGSDGEEVDELEGSQSQNISKVASRLKPAVAPLPKKNPSPERTLVPSTSPMAPALNPEQPPPPPLVQPLRKKAPLPKPRMSKKDENIFVSTDAERSPSSSPTRPTKSSPRKSYAVAPKIVEGPYRSQLKRVRSRVESDSDEAPPKRARRNPESVSGSGKKGERAQAGERVSQKQTKENIGPETMTASTVKKGATQMHGARKTASQGLSAAKAPKVATPQSASSSSFPQPSPSIAHRQATENAVASSSRVRLSDIPQPPKKVTVVPVATPVSTNRSQPSGFKPTAAPILSPEGFVPLPISPPPQSLDATNNAQREGFPRRDSGVIISPGAHSEVDFFTAPLHISGPGNSKGKEREYVLDMRPPRIDLRRESLHRQHSQIQSVSQVARTDSRASSASNLMTSDGRSRGDSAVVEHRQPRMSVASNDAINVLLEWTAPLIDMALKYNVADAVAVSLFRRLMSMEATEVVLFALGCGLTEEEGLKAYSSKKTVARAKEALRVFAQSKKIFEEDESSGSGEEEMPPGLVLRSQVPSASRSASVSASAVKVEKRESGTSALQVSVAPSTQRRRSRPSLIIRRIPADWDDAKSDYIPPKNTRADQYARLQKQGRLSEAKEREKNRILITQSQSQYVPAYMHSPTVSPTPHVRGQAQDVSHVMMDVDTVGVDGYREEEPYHEPRDVDRDGQEQGEDSDGDVFVDAEEESQRDDIVMAESSEDEGLDAPGGDGTIIHAVDEVDEQYEENGDDGDVEQPSDGEGNEEDQSADEAVLEQEEEEEDADAEEDRDLEAEPYTEDNGIFGSRESDDEPEEEYYNERGTPTTNSDSDPDEHHRLSSPFDGETGEGHSIDHVAEAQDAGENPRTVDQDDDDIYLPESLEMPYPGQPQRYEDSQEVPETEPEVPSSTSRMQPSSFPSLLTFGSGGPDKDPEVADIAKEHRGLALDATAENYQKLNDFERKHSDKSDLLRLWSIKWAKALMQHHTTDDE